MFYNIKELYKTNKGEQSMLIKKKRISAGMTQEELSNALGVTQSAVAMWETEKAQPRAEMLIKLATVLGCTVDELLREPVTVGEGEK